MNPSNSPASQTTGIAFWVGIVLLAALFVFPLLYLCSLIVLSVCFGMFEDRFIIAALPASALTLTFLYCYRRYPKFKQACNTIIEWFESLQFIGGLLRFVLDIFKFLGAFVR